MKTHLSDMDAKKLLHNKLVIEEINRHKWLESEIAGCDIGFEAAAKDWINNHANAWVTYYANKKLTSLLTSRQGSIKSVFLKKKYFEKYGTKL
jgi:fructosamine-3-kinase